jgi:hypothetical protein
MVDNSEEFHGCMFNFIQLPDPGGHVITHATNGTLIGSRAVSRKMKLERDGMGTRSQ